MHAHSYIFPDVDLLPLLDEEFDKADAASRPADHASGGTGFLCDDRAWDDQLDNGEEMSL